MTAARAAAAEAAEREDAEREVAERKAAALEASEGDREKSRAALDVSLNNTVTLARIDA